TFMALGAAGGASRRARTVVACHPSRLSRSATSRRTSVPCSSKLLSTTRRNPNTSRGAPCRPTRSRLAIEHPHRALQGRLVHLHLAPTLAHVVLQSPHRESPTHTSSCAQSLGPASSSR